MKNLDKLETQSARIVAKQSKGYKKLKSILKTLGVWERFVYMNTMHGNNISREDWSAYKCLLTAFRWGKDVDSEYWLRIVQIVKRTTEEEN